MPGAGQHDGVGKGVRWACVLAPHVLSSACGGSNWAPATVQVYIGVHLHLTFPTCQGRGASPESHGGQQGASLMDPAPSAPKHLSPSSQEVSVEFVSKYRLWWPSGLRTAPLASRLNGRTSAAFQGAQACRPPLGAVGKNNNHKSGQ